MKHDILKRQDSDHSDKQYMTNTRSLSDLYHISHLSQLLFSLDLSGLLCEIGSTDSCAILLLL
jgi:hypothetical protein